MMRFMWLFFLCLCVIPSILSKEDVLADKIRQLTEWSSKKSVIRLNTERFNHYVKGLPKNYSIIVMLTALAPQRQCSICKLANDEYQVVAHSYRHSNAFSDKLFFAMVDFDEGAEVFQSLKLNSAPVFIHFPPKGKPTRSDSMDINRHGLNAEQLIKWVHDRTGVQIVIFRPPNYSGYLLTAIFGLITLGLLYLKRNSLGFLNNKPIWGVLVLCIVCYFISGQTWNLINNPPFSSNRKGAMDVFADDSNMQYIAETYVVFLLYFGLCAGMILLNEAPKLKIRTGTGQTIMAILGILMVIFFFSYLLSVFRAKYQGYPYSFLMK